MNDSYRKLLILTPLAEPSSRIKETVLDRVRQFEGRRLRLRFAAHAFLALAAFLAAAPALRALVRDLAVSGLSDYLSLIVSDTGYVLAHLSSYLVSVGESLPLLAVIAVVATVLIFVDSLRRAALDRYSMATGYRQFRAVKI